MNQAEDGNLPGCVVDDDVLITEELAHRPARAPDYAAENRALAALIQEMVQHPDRVLQRVAEMAMQLCRADSAGISVLEPGGENGIFRWHAAAGAFAPNLYGTMPRDASPCGTVIARNEVLLFNEGDRFFPALRGVEPRIYENLLAPWTSQGAPVGTVWVIKHTVEGRFDAEDARLLASLARFASAAWAVSHEITERLRAEKASRESAARLRLIVESARDYAIFTTDAEGVVIDWYSGAETVFGYAAPEIQGRPADILYIPEDRAAGEATKELQQARSEGSAPDVRWHLRKDGQHVFIDGHTTALQDAEGQLTGFLKIGQDVTERKRLEETRRQTEERQAFFLRLSDALRFLQEPEQIKATATQLLGEQLAVNRVFYADAANDYWIVTKGYETGVDPLPNQPFAMAAYGPWIIEGFRAGQPLVVEDMHADSRFQEPEWEANLALQIGAVLALPLVKRGELVAMLVAHHVRPRQWSELEIAIFEEAAERTWAIVERARTEAALRDSEQRFRLLVDNVQEYALFQTDLNGRVTSWNPGAERLFGYTSAEMLGQPASRLFTPEDQQAGVLEQELARARAGQHPEDRRWMVCKQGRRFWAQWVTEPVHDDAGQLRGMAKVLRDETERKGAEERHRLLIGELNHRVKNTLAIVQAIANQTLHGAADPSEFAARFQDRLQALSSAHNLLTRTTWEGADVGDIVCAQLTLNEDGDQISATGPPAFLDAQSSLALALVLHELGTNARKYGALSVPEGRLTIEWNIERDAGDARLHLEWTEQGGPLVRVPERKGFGTTLITRSLRSVDGQTELSFAPGGMRCWIELPLGSGPGKGLSRKDQTTW